MSYKRQDMPTISFNLTVPFSDEIKTLVMKARNKSSPGPNGIPYLLLEMPQGWVSQKNKKNSRWLEAVRRCLYTQEKEFANSDSIQVNLAAGWLEQCTMIWESIHQARRNHLSLILSRLARSSERVWVCVTSTPLKNVGQSSYHCMRSRSFKNIFEGSRQGSPRWLMQSGFRSGCE